jgi:ABC-type branched-subunit amino acid transport system substrate-binding protein
VLCYRHGRAALNPQNDRFAHIARLLGVDSRYAGTGLKFDIGAIARQTGPGELYGDRIAEIPNLACRHIVEMGGPAFNVIMRDHRSGDAKAGTLAMQEFAAAKVPMLLSTYSANHGALLPDIERYEMLTLDGGGGAPPYAQGKPYFWGSIATTPNDALVGAIAFVRKAFPDVARVASVRWDLGVLDPGIVRGATRYFSSTGLAITADVKSAIGATDYSIPLAALRESSCDAVFCFLYGQDVGYFMRQYAASGIGKPVIAFAHSSVAQRIAGHAYDGLYLAFDYFDAKRPANPWATFYLDEFREIEEPDFMPDNYLANVYEDIFALWACVRRVLEHGGDPSSGRRLDAALRSDPVFPSLYGGDAQRPGSLRFDLATHSVDDRPMTVAHVESGTIVPIAHFQSGVRTALQLV